MEKSESIGNQTDEDSVEAVSDGEDTGFTEEESVPEEKTEQKTEASAKQFLMIILTLLGSMYPGGCHYFCNS